MYLNTGCLNKFGKAWKCFSKLENLCLLAICLSFSAIHLSFSVICLSFSNVFQFLSNIAQFLSNIAQFLSNTAQFLSNIAPLLNKISQFFSNENQFLSNLKAEKYIFFRKSFENSKTCWDTQYILKRGSRKYSKFQIV